jgi:hypothetical protein
MMKIAAALISAGVAAAFFVATWIFYYQPTFIGDHAFDAILTTNHSKARAAVSRLLFNPASAQFDVLRSVEVDAAKYVCGNVNAKDKSGAYAGYKAFVYTVAIDFARIDDDGQIAQLHDAFKTCPLSEEEERREQQKLTISPGAVSMLKTVQKAIPTADPSTLSTLSTMASQPPSAGGKSSSASTEQQLGQLAGQTGSGGQLSQPGSIGQQQSSSTFKVAIDNQGEWRSDRPPAAWPVFPPDHPLSPPTQKGTTAQALAQAAEVEERWAQFKAGNSKARPSPDDIRRALRGLLAIDPKDEGFPRAWGAFVRLRKIERDGAA